MHTQFPQKWLLPTLNENLLKAAKKAKRKQPAREKWCGDGGEKTQGTTHKTSSSKM